uniref:Uncharacterized protein n=1 Tax=Parascaris equorum TaxID=6256 RepID=A0A914RWS2_PAREQ
MRYLDGCPSQGTVDTCVRRVSVAFDSGNRFEWITPFICLFACTVANCAASVLLALLWLFSFLSSAIQLPVLVFPTDCQRAFLIDRNTAQWIGFWPEQTWPVIALLLMISLRCVFGADRTQWLSEIKRSNADEDISSLIKFLAKYSMHKFGVEVSLIYGVILVCAHHDVYGLLLLTSIALLRVISRRRQALLWPAYSRFFLVLLIIEYVSALGCPHQV